MTDKQPAQFDWATELSDAQGHVTLSAQEAKEIGARLRNMGAKLKTYEDLGEAGSDVQLLRTGYAAARLEIESIKSERNRFRAAYHEWSDKTEWARKSTTVNELGKHLADVLRERIEGLQAALKAAQPVVTPQPGAAYAALHDVDSLAQEIRRVDGAHRLGAGALAEELMPFLRASHGQASASVLHLVHSAFAEIAMAFPKAFALHKVGIADTAVREALAAPAAVTGPVAVLKFERSTPGRQNEMPRVVSCNWMPDGEYEVYLAAAPTTQPAPQQEAQEPVAVVVPCYTPSGKRVALYSAKQDLPIGTQLYTAPQPSPAVQEDKSHDN